MRLLFGSNPRAALTRATAFAVLAFVVFRFVLLPVRLQGISMLPTYSEGSFDFANRAAYWLREPGRGDVVAIRMAGPSVFYVKRIVGMPGERLAIVKGMVTVDGQPLAEPTVIYRTPWNLVPFTLGPNEYFVAGDNRSMMIADHDLGRTTRDRIVGKLLF